MKAETIVPLILCGGTGSRLWPLSRASFPKQYLEIDSKEALSFLQCTVNRIKSFKRINDPIVICNEEHRFIVAEQMRSIEVKPKAIILENEGRNTAPAITLGALKALEIYKEDTLLLVLSADHIIEKVDIFLEVLKKGIDCAENNKLVTFGIIPKYPETGYGYIESESVFKEGVINTSKIKQFIEKPNKELAKKLTQSNKFTWNSGMFIFKTSLILREIENHSPMVLKQCQKAMNKNIKDLDFIRIDSSEFSKTPNIPIDIALIDGKTKRRDWKDSRNIDNSKFSITLSCTNPPGQLTPSLLQSCEKAVFSWIRDSTSTLIEVDGGVTIHNAKKLIENGADVLVSGSHVFKAENPKEIISKLKHI